MNLNNLSQRFLFTSIHVIYTLWFKKEKEKKESLAAFLAF